MASSAALHSDSEALPVPSSFWRRGLQIYFELGKVRLVWLVVLTTAMSYGLADGDRPWSVFICTLIGTALAAWSANALNQGMEHDRDRRMGRTQNRPVPSGRVSSRHAVLIGLAVGGFGISLLAAYVNLLTAGLGLLSFLLYVLVYTPLKTRTTLNTLVGSVVGAIPPMMGWTAAAGQIETGAWVLAGLLLVWQIPHFLALAWMYRQDYQRGGFRMLSAMDSSGRITAYAAALWSLALIPISASAWWVGLGGVIYLAAALVLGSWLFWLSLQLYRERNHQNARRLFLASVLYLPLILGLMMLDPTRNRGQSSRETAEPAHPVHLLPAAHP